MITSASLKRFFDTIHAADGRAWRSDFFPVRGEPTSLAHKRVKAATELSKEMDVWSARRGKCAMSPRIVTLRLFRWPMRSRMVSASRRPWEGCSWVAVTGVDYRNLQMPGHKNRPRPEEEWRITKQSGRMAFQVVGGVEKSFTFFLGWRLRPEGSWCPATEARGGGR